MPADLPAHNDPIPFNRGNWVPVGWKPLEPTEKVRKAVFAHIARRKAEAQDQELQRNAKQKRKEEKRELKRRAAQELVKCDVEIERLKAQHAELANEKTRTFAKLKEVCAKESSLKKAEEEKRRIEASIQLLSNPNAAALRSLGGPVQSTSLISQQNLNQQFYYPPNSTYQSLLQAQLIQQLASQRQQQQQQQQTGSGNLNKQGSILPIINSTTASATVQNQQRHQLLSSAIPAAHSPFYPTGSNYASPAPSRNFIPQQQALNSPRRERTLPPSAMASPSAKYHPGQGAQSRHNSIGAAPHPMSAVDQLKEAKNDDGESSYSQSPSNPSSFIRGLANYQNPAEADAASVALHRGFLLQQQHQPSPSRR